MKRNIISDSSFVLALSFFSPVESLAPMADIGTAELTPDAKVIVQGEVKSVKFYKGN